MLDLAKRADIVEKLSINIYTFIYLHADRSASFSDPLIADLPDFFCPPEYEGVGIESQLESVTTNVADAKFHVQQGALSTVINAPYSSGNFTYCPPEESPTQTPNAPKCIHISETVETPMRLADSDEIDREFTLQRRNRIRQLAIVCIELYQASAKARADEAHRRGE